MPLNYFTINNGQKLRHTGTQQCTFGLNNGYWREQAEIVSSVRGREKREWSGHVWRIILIFIGGERLYFEQLNKMVTFNGILINFLRNIARKKKERMLK